MQTLNKSSLFISLLVVTALVAVATKEDNNDKNAPPIKEQELLAIAPPPFSEGIFPCSECHFEEDEVDTAPRDVDFHDTVTFNHASESRWCLDCHDSKNRDMLHLADGRLISFEESYRLCGQCHAQQKNDWMAGDHGRRTGSWSGQKEYLLCAHCHNPHRPAFQPLKPQPAPIRQEKIR
jgi:hypothetical protein